ncbi:hypothetical protein ABQ37_004412 [Salmonella enterica subsp. enterica serovar Sandiego]|uniref:Protein traS n=1 Tax=Salmonella oranienberg TaxID=28147 RepID=A0A5W8FS62_SALON|nr:hypothetical protein [Salmonella enterica]EBR8224003.1 hypothetical protein [Salmonella enterica subsp. enterica serovar Oranienburg]EBV9368670.1 hypothetical protein [Salmonella enterica subsp. enterica serovar Sandiego]ECT6635819.1 hypothetical protein [Salmonella enterica subsp. enterica serovar Rissen]EDV1763280.1 hypothetical protein [Salmonella enterica subsp. enterica serovar Hvittingfoss]EEJ7304468.1 hypothetical protein [Salmonella enterica subsp. enterica]EHE7049944.1 hypothetica
MKITRSMLEQDAQYLLESVRTTDYEIPQSGDIFKAIFKVYGFVVLLQIIAVFFDWFLYSSSYKYYSLFSMLVFSGLSLVIIFGVLCIMLYQNVSLVLCIPEEVRRQSLFCQIVRKKLRSYFAAVIFFNVIVASILLYCGQAYAGGLGASWFFSLGIASVSFSYSIGRYFTPPVISALNKIAETVSLAGAGK